MQAASELLGLTPPAPLSAILVARPVRACVVVPAVEGVAWERLVEHALAAQARVWGGTYNLVVPTGWEIADDELFWRLVDRFDPDLVALHLPTYADVEEIAPEKYAEAIDRADQQLRNLEFDEETRAREITRLRDEVFWQLELSAELRSKLVERVAPLRMGDDDPRSVYVDGTRPPSYPLTDVAALRELPGTVLDVRSTLDDVDQLMLTHAVGRLLASFKSALEERGMTTNDVLIEHQAHLFDHVWPRGRVVSDFGYPRLLTEIGLARRLSIADRDQVVVVVGDEPRDFLLYQGLSRLRPHVYWLPTARLDNQVFLNALTQAAWHAVRTEIGGGDFAVTTASSDEAAAAAIEVLNGSPGRDAPEARLVDWKAALPRSPLWSADARSERRVSLLRHEGETQELQTPTPVSVSVPDGDPSKLRWMVDVEVQGWRPARHPALGAQVLRGAVVTNHDVRTSTIGPSYFGLGPLVQAFLGLEGSTARPRLRPRAIVEQVTDVLQPLGWEVSLSDKGAYALQSAGLFGGVEELASALRSEATRALLDAYLTPTTSNNPGIYLSDTRRRYFSLEEARGVVGEADIPALVAELYDRGALVRGHALKCENCRATSFYSLSEEQRFICVRCRTSQRATRFSWLETPEPEFRYALSEVLFQFLKNNGQLPLLAAYDHFVVGRGREREPFDIACELDLTSPDGQLREHDIVATWGAEMWIGEATVADRLEESNADEVERLERLSATAQALCARGVLFVTTSDRFGERTKQNVRNVFADPAWPDVVYLEGFDAGSAAPA
jgi:hypothetical protein